MKDVLARGSVGKGKLSRLAMFVKTVKTIDCRIKHETHGILNYVLLYTTNVEIFARTIGKKGIFPCTQYPTVIVLNDL